MPEQCAWSYSLPNYGQCDDGEFCDDEAADGEPYCAEHGRLADV